MAIAEYEDIAAQEPESSNDTILSRENFTYQAEDIIATLRASAQNGEPLAAGLTKAHEAYVADEENPNLREFSAMLLGARNAEVIQKNLDTLKPKIESRTATNEEKQRYYDLRDAAIAYNHQVRDVIWNNPQLITKDDLSRWLEMAGSGDERWSQRLLQGMASEIAVARQIQMVPGVREVRMSTIEEDAKGVDIVPVLLDGSEIPIDVKSGQQSLGYMPRRNGGMELGVDLEMLSGFAVKHEYQNEVRQTFARATKLENI